MSRNLAASIRARLKQRADVAKQDFNLTLTHYGLERLLYRLSISDHAPNFLLKGALLFSLWYDLPHRPTRDADLLGFGPDDIDSAVATFRENLPDRGGRRDCVRSRLGQRSRHPQGSWLRWRAD